MVINLLGHSAGNVVFEMLALVAKVFIVIESFRVGTALGDKRYEIHVDFMQHGRCCVF